MTKLCNRINQILTNLCVVLINFILKIFYGRRNICTNFCIFLINLSSDSFVKIIERLTNTKVKSINFLICICFCLFKSIFNVLRKHSVSSRNIYSNSSIFII